MIYRPIVLSLIALAGLVGPRARAAAAGDLYNPPSAALSIYTAMGRPVLYGAARPTAEWHVGQYNNPSGDIGDFSGGTASNASLGVSILPGPVPVFRIAQDGSRLHCTGPGGLPLEFDGLIGTNTRSNNPGVPTAERSVQAKASLAQYGALRQRIDLRLVSVRDTAAPACKVTESIGVVTVVLSNSMAASTLFVQLVVYEFGVHPRTTWWATGKTNGIYGYNIVTPMATADWRPGERRQLDMDVLASLRDVVRSNEVGMDADPGHWVVSGAYFGTSVYGPVAVSTEWSGYRLTGSVVR